MSKGSRRRDEIDYAQFCKNWEKIFGDDPRGGEIDGAASKAHGKSKEAEEVLHGHAVQTRPSE